MLPPLTADPLDIRLGRIKSVLLAANLVINGDSLFDEDRRDVMIDLIDAAAELANHLAVEQAALLDAAARRA